MAASALPAQAQGLQLREQDAAYQAARQGRILPLPTIRARIRVPGAQFIVPSSTASPIASNIMRGAEVIWIDVDARKGRILGRQ